MLTTKNYKKLLKSHSDIQISCRNNLIEIIPDPTHLISQVADVKDQQGQ